LIPTVGDELASPDPSLRSFAPVRARLSRSRIDWLASDFGSPRRIGLILVACSEIRRRGEIVGSGEVAGLKTGKDSGIGRSKTKLEGFVRSNERWY